MGAACKILVVEDEAIIALDLAQQLEGFGYAIAGVAHSAADAVAQAHHVSPDLVLMDIVLRGGEDGITAAHRIGADLRIPIIYLTAYSDGATVARAAQTGPYGYLTKPFEPRQVRAVVEIALAKAGLERELLEMQQWLAATLHSVGDGVVATDVDGRVRLLNPVAAFLAGIDEAAAAGRDVAEVLRLEPPEGTTDDEHPVLRALARDECTGIPFGTRLLHADGGAVAIDDSVAPIHRPDGSRAGAVMVFRDVSERLRLEESLRASESRFQSAFMQAATGIAVVDLEGRIVLANPALEHLLGRSHGETVGGDWDAVLHPEFRAAGRELRDALAAGAARDSQLEVCIRRVEGATPWVLVSGAAVHDAAGRPQAFVYHVHDIDERKRAEARLEWLAHFDPLTGLANRARLQFEAERTLAAARRSGTQVALLFLDLDHFKRINDTLGHDAGDRLLREVGDRLRAATRTSDIVARLGGDEFVVLVEEVGRPEAALTVADKLRESVARPVWLDGQELKLTASVGVCLFPGDGDDIGALLRNADSALYHAKSQGRDTVAFYREEFTARTGERLRIEQALHRALEAREFVLHYQPVVELATGEVIGVEALLRWQRGGRLEAPATFVPALEESGLILAVGAWVLQEACRQARVWRDAGVPPLNIAVNISARQLRDPALDLCVTAALAAARLPAQRLCLEITETLLSDIGEVELATLEGLRNLGVTVAIDDFGVGYSSLSYLKHFKPRSLKIDRSFIVDVATDDTDAAIVSATIAMAHRLGIRVVAEGVETAPQLEFLRGEGCDAVQGFLLARPMPAEAIPALAASRLPPAPGA